MSLQVKRLKTYMFINDSRILVRFTLTQPPDNDVKTLSTKAS